MDEPKYHHKQGQGVQPKSLKNLFVTVYRLRADSGNVFELFHNTPIIIYTKIILGTWMAKYTASCM